MDQKKNTKSRRVALLEEQLRVNSPKIRAREFILLKHMREPEWPNMIQALCIREDDLPELAPSIAQLPIGLLLPKPHIYWVGDSIELLSVTSGILRGEKDSGILVYVTGEDISPADQDILERAEMRQRFRILLVTEQDPEGSNPPPGWKLSFRNRIITTRWPQLSERKADWKKIFLHGVSKVAKAAGLKIIDVHREAMALVMDHEWRSTEGVNTLIEFGRLCAQKTLTTERPRVMTQETVAAVLAKMHLHAPTMYPPPSNDAHESSPSSPP